MEKLLAVVVEEVVKRVLGEWGKEKEEEKIVRLKAEVEKMKKEVEEAKEEAEEEAEEEVAEDGRAELWRRIERVSGRT